MNLNQYLKQTDFTAPRDFISLYSFNASGSPEEKVRYIMHVVHALLIHPARQGQHPDTPAGDDEIWDNEPKTVYETLKKLQIRKNAPLDQPRSDQEKVLITCRGFTLLMTSLLRHNHIPARAKPGFATYITSGKHIDHWVCEYWNTRESRWITVDADFLIYDIPEAQFISAARAYLACRNEGTNCLHYGCDDYWGYCYILTYLNLDLLSVLGHGEHWYNPHTYLSEKLVWTSQSTYTIATANLTPSEKTVIDQTAAILLDPDFPTKTGRKPLDILFLPIVSS